MSERQEESKVEPPSFLPLAHSHNIVLDGIVDRERQLSRKAQNQHQEDIIKPRISASQEDVLNGNIIGPAAADDDSDEAFESEATFLLSKQNNDSKCNLLPSPLTTQSDDVYHIQSPEQTSLMIETESLPEGLLTGTIDALSLVSPNLVESVLNNNERTDNNSSKLKQTFASESEILTPGVELLWESEFTEQEADASERPVPENEIHHDKQKLNESVSSSGWRKLTDGDGTYYWNIKTGATQYEVPQELENVTDDSDLDTQRIESMDSSLADLEGAAFRYASLHIKDDESSDHDDSSEWTVSSDSGRMFSVRSLGWLPMQHCSSDPETSSVDVNACIRHLSSSHGQIMDGVGTWGDGKNLMLFIEDEYLKLVDPTTQTVLLSQAIKHIRVWGVGRDCAHDFAYVSRDCVTKLYKCHVFRCDVSAKAIARELHNVCQKLTAKNRKADLEDQQVEKEKLAMSTSIPVLKSETSTKFSVKYLGNKQVESVNGMQTIKNVIRDITTDDIALCEEATAAVSAAALLITSKKDGNTLVNCRMRCLSFMGIGDDISLFAFISVVASTAHCHVLQCLPNAAKLALSLQEACVLRFQRAVDSKQVPHGAPKVETPRRSVRQFVKGMFSRRKTESDS